MKVKLIILTLIIVGIFAYIIKSNNDDKQRQQQAEKIRVQNLQDTQAQEEVERNKELKKVETDKEIALLQNKYTMDYSEAKQVIESEKIEQADKEFYVSISKKWGNALKLAASTPRIALSQPVKDLQLILSELEQKKASTYCESRMKEDLEKSYRYGIEGFLGFMQQNEFSADGFTKLSSDSQSKATILLDYC